MTSHWSKDHYRVKCEEGICYIALSSLSKFMFCGSITECWYQEMPHTWIELDKETLRKNIVPLQENTMEECEAKLEMISENSFCLRIYKFNYDLGCEDDAVPYKIDPEDLLGIIRENFKALRELYSKSNV